MSKIIYLEDRFKINLNVTGDKTFISTNKYQKTVNLKIVNKHHTLIYNNQKTKVLLNGYQSKEQKLIMFEKHVGKYITCYGCNKKLLRKDEYIIDKLTNVYKLNDSESSIIDYYDEIMMKVNLLK